MKRLFCNCVAFLVIFVVGSCSQPPTEPVNVENRFELTQQVASNLAKALAVELNDNSNLRRDLFSKMAYKFDGDKNILLRHFSDASLEAIVKTSVRLKAAGLIEREVDVNSLFSDIPKPEIMMPFMQDWTDAAISAAGGLVVAYYPFGIDDRSIKQLRAFDKNGNAVTVTRDNCREIPYVLIRTSERTDEDGYLSEPSPI